MKDVQPVVGEWRGHPRYSCPLCAFDSLEATVVAEHIAWIHPDPDEPAPVVKVAAPRSRPAAPIAADGGRE